MQIGALIIGDEILSGRRQDKHLNHCIQALAQRGQELAWVNYCGDDEALLCETFRHIDKRNDLCFSFGGIGATHDDKTRQSLAAALEVPLERNADAVAEIESRYGESSYPHRVLMADLPQGSRIIPNPYNRIPGFSVQHIHCLPGFPEMAWPMMDWVLNELYPQLNSEAPIQLVLKLQDVHESELIDLMTDVQSRHPKIKLSSLPRFLDNNRREIELGIRGLSAPAQIALDDLKTRLLSNHFKFTQQS